MFAEFRILPGLPKCKSYKLVYPSKLGKMLSAGWVLLSQVNYTTYVEIKDGPFPKEVSRFLLGKDPEEGGRRFTNPDEPTKKEVEDSEKSLMEDILREDEDDDEDEKPKKRGKKSKDEDDEEEEEDDDEDDDDIDKELDEDDGE